MTLVRSDWLVSFLIMLRSPGSAMFLFMKITGEKGSENGWWLAILSHPDLPDIRRFLPDTRDAHGLYSQFGFDSMKNPERWMERFNG